MAFGYPVSLEVGGRRCVVVGGGAVAERKASDLVRAGGRVTVVASEVTAGLVEAELRGELALLRRAYARGDLAGAFLAVAASDDPAVNAAAFEEGDASGVLVNAVDDVAHCHFAVPAVVRRGELALAISTGGRAPALAKRLRRMIDESLDPELGAVVDLLGRVRDQALPEREVDFPTWADRWQDALTQDLAGMVRAGRADEAQEAVRATLAGEAPGGDDGPQGRVGIVGAGPGDPGLLTVRGREWLDAADIVVHDRLVDPSLLAGRQAVFVGKARDRHCLPQDEINRLLVDLASEGRTVVRLKGGDPFVFGRGGEEAEALAEAGIAFEVVPGPSSALAAPAYAGIPVTDRRHASSVAVVSGHNRPGEGVDWGRLATAVDTVVVLMGMAHLDEIAAALVEGGRDPHTPAAAVENGTTADQQVVVATLESLPRAVEEAGLGPPATVVVGEVVRLRERIDWWRPGAPSIAQAPSR